MLVLTRRLNEKILFPGTGTSVQVVAIKQGLVRLRIAAPPNVVVLREEGGNRRPGRKAAEAGNGAAPAPLPEVNRMLQTRLYIAGVGLDQLRRQIESGHTGDAVATLDALEEDLRLLGQRLRDELAKSPQPLARMQSATSRRALLVEDNANERELLARFLRLAGLAVDTAGDGSDALDYLRDRGRPDVVLLDMGLPHLDGASTVRHIRRDPACAGLKIFAVSGHRPEEFDLARGPEGVDRWFQKPIDPAELIENLNREL
jgi:carbon storage regulator CsrA